MLAPSFSSKQIPIPVIKTVALQKKGVTELYQAIQHHIQHHTINDKRLWLLTEKAYYLIQQKRMADVSKAALKRAIEFEGTSFNLYQFIQQYQHGG
jgi:LAO/AO transport system kinase